MAGEPHQVLAAFGVGLDLSSGDRVDAPDPHVREECEWGPTGWSEWYTVRYCADWDWVESSEDDPGGRVCLRYEERERRHRVYGWICDEVPHDHGGPVTLRLAPRRTLATET